MRRWELAPILVALVFALASCAAPGGGSAGVGGAGAPPAATGSVIPFATMPPLTTPTSAPLPPAPLTATAVPVVPLTATPVRTPTGTPTPAVVPEVVSDTAPASCPVTRPPEPPFVPPAQGKLFSGAYFWYGTAALWVEPRVDGTWRTRSVKVFWWREGYSWTSEPSPDLVVTGRRLDAPAPPLDASAATNAYNGADIGSAMLVGVTAPTPGCWEITGRYRGAKLSFVVWVAR